MITGPCAECAQFLSGWKSAASNRERLEEEQAIAISCRDWDVAQALDAVIAEVVAKCDRACEKMLGHVRTTHGIQRQPLRNRHFVHIRLLPVRENPG